MNTYTIAATAPVPAAPETVYALIADYHAGHPRILPSAYFGDLTVEEGGIGEGTVIQFEMKVLGQTHRLRARVAEPAQGRVLTETNLGDGSVTTFVVEPSGTGAHVTISTELPQKPGLGGHLERFFLKRYLPRVFKAELAQIAEVVATGS